MVAHHNNFEAANSARAADLFREYQHEIHKHTDRLFAGLMGFQWVAGIVFALWVSPLTWDGPVSRTHLHVWAAILVGGTISLFPALLALLRPGRPSTRYTIAVAQMLMGALLIHLTGGRIETHFHVFGSLAFLAFYRDWRVLVPATDRRGAGSHAARGVLAAVGLRRAGRQPMALGGARRVGDLRRRVSLVSHSSQRHGDAGDGGSHGDARTGSSDAPAGGDRRAKQPGPQRRHPGGRARLRRS